jgi:integrase
LKGSDRCPYLLRPKKRAQIKEEKEDNAIAGSDLGRVYRLITQKYLVGTSGFGPHAVRHLVASAWLKHQPRDYVTVASILHDKLETVLNEYAHIDVNDGLKRYYEYSDKTIEYNTM